MATIMWLDKDNMQKEFLHFPNFSQISVKIVAHTLDAQILQELCVSGELSTAHSFAFW